MKSTGNYALVEKSYGLWVYVSDPLNPLTIEIDGRKFVLNESFETDGATIPRVFWWFPGLGPMDWPKAAILHDWLWEKRYTREVVGFIESNNLLYKAIRSLGWSRFVAGSCWVGTTLFGWHWWIKGLPK